jgi:hypothetical protein
LESNLVQDDEVQNKKGSRKRSRQDTDEDTLSDYSTTSSTSNSSSTSESEMIDEKEGWEKFSIHMKLLLAKNFLMYVRNVKILVALAIVPVLFVVLIFHI